MTEKRFTKRTIDNWESYIIDNETGEEYGNSIDPLINLLNHLNNEKTQLQERNDRQYQQLNQLWELIEKQDWETLNKMVEQQKQENEYIMKYGG